MAKPAICPACRSKVNVPPDAEPGLVLTCPDCDEKFTPPELVPKGASIEDEDSYEIHESRDEDDFESAERTEKRKKARAIQTAGKQYADRFKEKRKPMFDGTDIVLLVLAVAAVLGAVVGVIAAQKAPSTGMMVVIIFAFCFVMFVFAYRKIMLRK